MSRLTDIIKVQNQLKTALFEGGDVCAIEDVSSDHLENAIDQ